MTRIDHFTRNEYAPTDTRPVVVSVDAAYIPLVVAAIQARKGRSFWASAADYERGATALTTFQEALLSDITNPIVQAVDRVYMAIRQMSAGERFYLGPDFLPEPLPAVPPFHPEQDRGGLLQLLPDLAGTVPDGWPFGFDRLTNLSDVVKALRAGEPNELETLLGKIDLLGDASDVGALYNIVKGSAVDLAQLAEGGGTLATLIVSTLSQAAMMGLQSAQLDQMLVKLDRLIAALDGGGPDAPDGNLLDTTEAVRELLA
jgi:hypothetical protein